MSLKRIVDIEKEGRYNPRWLKEEQVKDKNHISKAIFYIILSLSRAIVSAVVSTAFLIVGIVLASSYFEPAMTFKKLLNIWGLIFILILLYDFIVYYKEIKK